MTWPISKSRRRILLLFSAGMLSLTSLLGGQSRPTPGPFVPLPDPGYGLYYHDTGAPNVPARWGYHDGWTDGRHDRNHGDTLVVQDKEQYKMPPEHGGHLGITRDNYIKAYREAYIHGYEHGSRI